MCIARFAENFWLRQEVVMGEFLVSFRASPGLKVCLLEHCSFAKLINIIGKAMRLV